MKKQSTFAAYRHDKYSQALARIERAIASGRFSLYKKDKKAQLLNRISRYARRLGLALKPALIAAGMAAGLALATPAVAQTFTEQTGMANPFNGVDVGSYSAPAFEDIDGDLDAFIGEFDGTINYFKNTGTASAPVFTGQTGSDVYIAAVCVRLGANLRQYPVGCSYLFFILRLFIIRDDFLYFL